MSDEGYKALLGMFAIAYFLANIALTIELHHYPMKSRVSKVFYYLLVWLIPLIGAISVHKKLKIGWAKGSRFGGHNGPVDPGDSGF
ncbi:hypothetical protein [Microbulbifer epialgicus]|uniref:Uncharacterized protein n=1 Tax=Microbulbifer epialgicus TaxID=393907 RepID=A0ABV4P6Y1_9GAMM